MHDTRSETPSTGFAYLDEALTPPGPPLAMAHRGGGKHPDVVGLENTMAAFRHAVGLGYRYLETDVHATSDGVLVVNHDASLNRVAKLPGRIVEMTAKEVAGAKIAGRELVPTMADLLEEFPDCRFNIDIKAPAAVEPLAALVAATGAHERVCVGAFDLSRIEWFRRLTGGRVATSASKTEAIRFLSMRDRERARAYARGRFAVLQLPRVRGPIPVVTDSVVRRAHGSGVQVHAWTVDRPRHMRTMIDRGVDGIFTDRTDLLKDVLRERGLWREHG
ncbi:glycerophosphodiester phosphodiesterase family protein [Nocardioides terrisoli]|uniref:glycerophosphodiester phosphodiesterase family protein n=1 Tax=Nocardioides terrisoli TaxID=3388267 RepID=UPI00287B8866|nr:glycerophosphodiester phosphodiesterase family protein [Nocardioides marmorisolisilvae]